MCSLQRKTHERQIPKQNQSGSVHNEPTLSDCPVVVSAKECRFCFSADYLARGVNAVSVAVRPPEGAKVSHYAILPEKSVPKTTGDSRHADYLLAISAEAQSQADKENQPKADSPSGECRSN